MSTFVQCPTCLQQMHEPSQACLNCGTPIPKTTAINTPTAYTSYAQVPWFRKRWFLLVSALLFMPATVVIAFTGPIYMSQGGRVKEFPKHQKWVILILCFGLIAWNISQLG